MKNFTTAALALCLMGSMAWAQTTTTPKAKAVPKTKAEPKSKVDARSKAEQTAAGIEAAEAAMTPEELAIAQRVFVGKVPCELGQFVTLSADEKMAGYFDVTVKNQKFHMFPVISLTGAIRLEDRRNGAVWLQLGNKSMLMSQKQGIRLADACVTPQQAIVQTAMDKAPPVNLLDGPARPRILPAGPVVTTTVTTTTTTTFVATPAAVGVAAATPASAASAASVPMTSVTTTTTTTLAPVTPAPIALPAAPAASAPLPAAPASSPAAGQ